MTADASAAGTWPLGDRPVNRLGFGAMRLTGTGAFDHGRPRDRATSIAVVRRAVELGVDHIDTAAFYFSSMRSANEILNAALSPYPDHVLIATKVGPGRDASGKWLTYARPEQLRGQVEENLRQLGRDHLDLVNLRTLGSRPVADRVGALEDLRREGLIRHIGLSNVTVAELEEARRVAPIACVQNRHGLGAVREDTAAMIDACLGAGIPFVPFFAIAGAGRERGPAAEHDAVRAVAAAHDATPAQVRIAWTLHQGPHVLAIPGTGDLAHLEQNVAAAALRLSDADLAALSRVA